MTLREDARTVGQVASDQPVSRPAVSQQYGVFENAFFYVCVKVGVTPLCGTVCHSTATFAISVLLDQLSERPILLP